MYKNKKNRSSNVQSRKLPNTPIKIKLLLKDTSGCKTYYNILSKSSVIPTSQIKYLEEGFMFTSSEWVKCYSLPFCSLKDPTLSWFQYQILHRIMPTNTFLHKIKLIDSNICNLFTGARNTAASIL